MPDPTFPQSGGDPWKVTPQDLPTDSSFKVTSSDLEESPPTGLIYGEPLGHALRRTGTEILGEVKKFGMGVLQGVTFLPQLFDATAGPGQRPGKGGEPAPPGILDMLNPVEMVKSTIANPAGAAGAVIGGMLPGLLPHGEEPPIKKVPPVEPFKVTLEDLPPPPHPLDVPAYTRGGGTTRELEGGTVVAPSRPTELGPTPISTSLDVPTVLRKPGPVPETENVGRFGNPGAVPETIPGAFDAVQQAVRKGIGAGVLGETGQTLKETLEGLTEPPQPEPPMKGPYQALTQDVPLPEKAPEIDNLTKATQEGAMASMPELAPDIMLRAQTLRGPKIEKGYEELERRVDAHMVNPQYLLTVEKPDVTQVIAMDRVAAVLGQKAEELTVEKTAAINAGKMDEAATLQQQIELHTARSAVFIAKASKGASEAGYLFNYLKNTRGDLNPSAAFAVAKQVKGTDLTDLERSSIANFAAQKDLDGMTQFIAGLKHWNKLSIMEQGWKTALISAPTTLAKIAATPLLALFNGLIKPARVGMSDLLSNWTHVDSDVNLPLALQKEAAAATARMFKTNMGKIVKGQTPHYGSTEGESPFGMGLEAKPFKNVPLVGPALQTAYDVIIRTHSGLHQLAMPAVYQWKAFERGYAIARSAGLKGEAANVEAIRLTQESSEVQHWAAQQAYNYVLLNKNVLSRTVGGMHQLAGRMGSSGLPLELGTTYVAPFSRISGNIIGKAVEMTPLGLPWAAIDLGKLIRGLKGGVPKSELMDLQGQFTSRLARAGAGSAAVALTGYLLAKNGLMMGRAPQGGASEKKIWDAQGRSPYSFSLDGGKTWKNLVWVGPLGLAMAMGANYAVEGNPLPPVARESFLENAADVGSALLGEAGALKQAGRHAVAGLVPQGVQAVTKATDPYTREGHGFLGTIRSVLPGLSESEPAKLGANGRPLTHETGFRALLPDNYPREKGVPTAAVNIERRNVLQNQYLSRVGAINKQLGTLNHQVGSLSPDRIAELKQDLLTQRRQEDADFHQKLQALQER